MSPLPLIKEILSLPRAIKHSIVIFIDILLCITTSWLAFFLRLGELIPFNEPMLKVASTSILLSIPLFFFFGLYQTVYRHAGWQVLSSVGRAIFIYGIAFIIIFTLFGKDQIPRTIGIIQPILLFLSIASSRLVARYMLSYRPRSKTIQLQLPKAVIYGAGEKGKQLENALKNSQHIHLVGFLDDDRNLQGSTLNGLRIYDPKKIAYLKTKHGVSTVLMALPNLDAERNQVRISHLLQHSLNVRVFPNLSDIANGRISLSKLRDIEIEDLLGRAPVPPDQRLFSGCIKEKTVLITGAGGSIGSELCRQIMKLKPLTLIMLDQNEYSLYSISEEINNLNNKDTVTIISLIGSVQDEKNINRIFKKWCPDTVFHAAAYKHVPLVEQNIFQALKTNIFGTVTLVKAAANTKVKTFILISTDKAVRPTNVMGASKRIAELILQAYSSSTRKTVFAMVRFGNVLGSSGSVIPKFKNR